jgi:predicted nucleotide-binding protein (sugar kinase/HSP70/actin superfamily)
MCNKLDEIEEFVRTNAGFEQEEGTLDKILNKFINKLNISNDGNDINLAYGEAKDALKKTKLNIPKNPIKVAIIGEMYEVLDQYANHFLEKELAKYNILVYRDLALSRMMFKDIRPEILKKLQPYVKYEAGASTVYTIEHALKYAKQHVDGMIHLKSFGCTPECDMMPIIQNIAQDYKIPVLYLSKDTQTSTTGLKTRLEAFVDMLIRKRQKNK